MYVVLAFLAKACTSSILFPVMPCLAELNNWLLVDQDNNWTEEELEATLFPPNSLCLGIQSIPNLKPKPAKRSTVNGFMLISF